MATRTKQFAIATMLSVVASFVILLTATRAEQSVLVNKPATTSSEPATGPMLPPPQNPNDDATVHSRAVQLPPQSERLPAPEALPTPPQRAVVPSQTNQRTSAPATKQSFMRPAEPRLPARGKLVGEEPGALPMPADASPTATPMLPPPGDEVAPPSSPLPSGIQVKPTPRIDYDTHHDARKMLRGGQINIAMLTQDPADGCYYQIPLTIPACCVGEPSVSGGRGLLGRGIVAYEWPCGFKAKIKFRHILGDVKVDYEAD
jgi:hypothetical protein